MNVPVPLYARGCRRSRNSSVARCVAGEC
jgi:hypothetical protein